MMAEGDDRVVIPFDIDLDISGGDNAALAERDERISDLEAQMADMKAMLDALLVSQRQNAKPDEDEEEPEPTPDDEPDPEPEPVPEPKPLKPVKPAPKPKPAPEPKPNPEPEPDPEPDDDDEEDDPKKPRALRYKPPPDPLHHPAKDDETEEDELRRRYEQPTLPKGKRYDKQRERLKGKAPITFDELKEREEQRKRLANKYGAYPPTHPGAEGRRLTTGGQSHMLSKAGIGDQPRAHFPQKRPLYRLPPTSGAPFTVPETGSDSPFGVGKVYVRGTGTQQEKINRRGNIRDRTSATATAGIAPDGIKDQIKELEREMAELRRGQKGHATTIKDINGKFQMLAGGSTQAISNPQQFVGSQMLRLLGGAGPHGAAVVAAITAIISAPKVMETIIQTLSTKGMPFNADWHRLIETEVNALFDIEAKKRRLLGEDGFVVTQTDSYQPGSGATTHNSFMNRHELVISKSIGLAEKALGVTY